jgi:hypothetical protein
VFDGGVKLTREYVLSRNLFTRRSVGGMGKGRGHVFDGVGGVGGLG